MNGTQQRTHRTATLQLANSLSELAEATSSALAGQDSKRAELAATLQRQIGEERTHRLALANEQRGYVDNENRIIRQSVAALAEDFESLADRGFWGRLNWLLRGK